jgi:hypothetical protein
MERINQVCTNNHERFTRNEHKLASDSIDQAKTNEEANERRFKMTMMWTREDINESPSELIKQSLMYEMDVKSR